MIRYNTNLATLESFANGAWASLVTNIPTTVALIGGNSLASLMKIGTTTSQNLSLITNNNVGLTLDTNGNLFSTTNAGGPQLSVTNQQNRAVLQLETDTSSGTGNTIMMRKARGLSSTSPTSIASNDVLGAVFGKGYGGNTTPWNDVATYDVGMEYRASEAFTTTAHGSRIQWYTTPIGSVTKVFRMIMLDSGYLGINNAGPTALLHVSNDATTNAAYAIQANSGIPNAQNQGFFMSIYPRHTQNVNLDDLGGLFQGSSTINSGFTNSGSETGIRVQSMRNFFPGTTDSGTVVAQVGAEIQFGSSNVVAGQTPQTNIATGVQVAPFNGSGTTSTAISLRLLPPSNSGGTIGSLYGIYADTTGTNYFAGKMGLGTTTPTTALSVAGVITPSADNTYTLGSSTLRFSSVYAVTGTIQTSDARLKKDITDTELGLDFLTKLRPVSFRWNTGADHKEHYGLIAQELKKTLDEVKPGAGEGSGIVDYDKESDRYGVRYSELISPIIRAVHELHDLILGTKRDVTELKAENARLKQADEAKAREITELKARMDRLELMIKAGR